jgi:hypothetical protein
MRNGAGALEDGRKVTHVGASPIISPTNIRLHPFIGCKAWFDKLRVHFDKSPLYQLVWLLRMKSREFGHVVKIDSLFSATLAAKRCNRGRHTTSDEI